MFAGWSAFHPNLPWFAAGTSITAQKFDRQWRFSNCHHYPHHYPHTCKLDLSWLGFGGNSFLRVFGNRNSRGDPGGREPPRYKNLGCPGGREPPRETTGGVRGGGSLVPVRWAGVGRAGIVSAIEAIRKIINEAAEDPTLEEVTSDWTSGMPSLVSESDTDSIGGY